MTWTTRAAGAQRGILTEGFRLVPEPTAAERDTLAKRATFGPASKTMVGGMSADPKVLAAIQVGKSADFRPAGTAKGF